MGKIGEDTRIMADLLRKGFTMLNLSCPICNNPLFRNKEEKIFCPVCKREVIVQEEDKIETQGRSSQKKYKEEKNLNSNGKKTNIPLIKSRLIEVLFRKLELIISKIEKEDQIDILSNYYEILSRTLDLLDKTEEI